MSSNAETNESWVVLNGEALPAAQARVSPLGGGFQLGHGVYTSFKLSAGRPCFFREHHARLAADASAVGLEAPSPAGLLDRLRLCAARNRITEAAMKVLLFQDVVGTGELVQVRAPSPLAGTRARGCRLMTVGGPAAHPGLAQLKSTSYLAHWRARQEALARGFDEALWVTSEGEALECAGANLFVAQQGELLTPPVERGLLPGVIRGVLLQKFPGAREARITSRMLAEATEVFITNSLIGVLPVRAIDGREFEVARYRLAPAAAETVRAAERLG